MSWVRKDTYFIGPREGVERFLESQHHPISFWCLQCASTVWCTFILHAPPFHQSNTKAQFLVAQKGLLPVPIFVKKLIDLTPTSPLFFPLFNLSIPPNKRTPMLRLSWPLDAVRLAFLDWMVHCGPVRLISWCVISVEPKRQMASKSVDI